MKRKDQSNKFASAKDIPGVKHMVGMSKLKVVKLEGNCTQIAQEFRAADRKVYANAILVQVSVMQIK
ncbi:hypothetical protein LTR27_009063 [Elasticomyces elasticus]|nr:hypothetical protein LTR27_009063 [Elasticomyces elasticus]